MSDTLPPRLLRPGRRGFLGSAGASAAAVALAGALGRPGLAEAQTAGTYTDADILNFALNLEYLEAEYYLRGTTGAGLPSQYTSGQGSYGGVISTPPTPQVTFTHPYIQQFGQELAMDEMNHVIFLRSQLGSGAIAEPTINLGTAFDTLAQAAGIGSSFDPFSSEINFLIGGFIFEDVGATAYHGAAPMISSKSTLLAAAGILGTEGYHAAGIRAYLADMAEHQPGAGIFRTTDLISNLRDQLDGPGNDDQGLTLGTAVNIAPVDPNGLIYARTFTQVLRIVYGNTAATPGLFLPQGANGVIH